MTLIDERELIEEQEKKKRVLNFLKKAILILVVLGLILLVYMSTKDLKKFKVMLNGNQVSNIDDGLLLKDQKGKIVEENGQVYISIQKLSTILNNEYFNGEYKKKDEDKAKCQIRIENIYTSYVSDSNKIYKVIVYSNDEKDNKNNNTNNEDASRLQSEKKYEYFSTNNNVKNVDNVLYASIDAIKIGFDVSISYDSKKNTLDIYSLDYLEKIAKSKRNDYVPSNEYEYTNKRLLKYGMTIVKNSDGNLGVGSYTNEQKLNSCVASCKYSSIEFNEAAKTLSVVTSSDNQKCILYLNLDKQEVEQSITSQYTDIKEIDNNFEYFVIKDNDKMRYNK